MYKPKDISDSEFINNTSLHRSSETCNGVPKITTLMNSQLSALRKNKFLLSPAIARRGTPRRYSLSEASPSTSRSNLSVNTAHSPGPLLASLSFKDNVSMYEETRSSGLARRIVLYNEEAEQEQHPTHQERYSSPGLFPIVHLFKKKPPLLEQSPKRVKIKLSSPEYLRSYSPQHRYKVLEELTKPQLHRQHSLPSPGQTNDTGTRSVLEALKEISRKRIHSNEDHDHAEETGKRIRTTELQNDHVATSSKRSRADSPLLDSSKSPTPKQSQKKFCVYDEFAASRSSSDFSFLAKSEPLTFKRKTISTSTESLTDSKHVKLVNAETQTLTTISENQAKSAVSDETDDETSEKKECTLKVFDDAPLERIRKSRLAALMGNLAGKDAAMQLNPKATEKAPEVFKERNVPVPPEEKPEDDLQKRPLVSILSTPKSTKETSPLKPDRHVQFNMSANLNPVFSPVSLTQTSSSIVTPIVSDSITKSPISDPNKTSFPVNTSMESFAKSAATSSVVPTFSTPVSSKNETTVGSNILVATSGSAAPSFGFSESFAVTKTPEKLPGLMPSTSSSPPKPGGFKFDLKAPVTSVNKSNMPSLSFPLNANATNNLSTPTFVPQTQSSAALTFGKPTESNFQASTPTPGPMFAFGEVPKSLSFNFGSYTNGPKFGSSEPSSRAFTAPTFGPLTSTTTSTASTLPVISTSSGFGTFKANPSIDEQNANKATPMFSCEASSVITTSSVFGTKPNSIFTTNNSAPTTSAFAYPTASTTFGTSPALNLTFCSAPTTSTSAFGNTSVQGFGNTQVTTVSVFGSAPTTTTSLFGVGSAPTTTATMFGSAPTTTTSLFGNTSTTTATMFGNYPAATASAFGSTPATTASVFECASTGFGAKNALNIPGFKPPANSNFGSGQLAFGSTPTTTIDTKSSSFHSTHGFGPTAGVPLFGNNTTASAFGAPAQPPSSTPTSNPPPYRSPAFSSLVTASTAITTAAFGTSNAAPTFTFGSIKPTSANPFGEATTTSAGSFGTSSTFPATGGFNNSSAGFGSSAPPAFGQDKNKPAFAFGAAETKAASVFGSGTGNSAFGKPTNPAPPQSGFGSTATGFGSTSPSGFNTQQTNGGFNFGANAAAAAPFGFGSASSNNEPAKPSFNFTGGPPNPPSYGAINPAPAFGAPAPNFGGSTPSFAATGSPAAGVFNIGAGSAATGRPRTQLRAKRRT